MSDKLSFEEWWNSTSASAARTEIKGIKMKYIKTRWKGYWLSWFWSEKYWYVTAIDRKTGERLERKTPIGSGKTRDIAFSEFKGLLFA